MDGRRAPEANSTAQGYKEAVIGWLSRNEKPSEDRITEHFTVILPVHQLVRARVADTISRLFNLPADDPAIAEMPLATPPNRALGDVSVPVAFTLARRLRKAPRAIAQELAGALGAIDGVVRVDAAPNGYLNFFLDRPYWLRKWAVCLTAEAAQADAH